MRKSIITLTLCALAGMIGINAQNCPIRVKWVSDANTGPRTAVSHFEITNISAQPLEAGWELCFNTFARALKTDENAPMTASEIKNYNYWRLTTNERYHELKPGETMEVKIDHVGQFSHIVYAPDGGHAVVGSQVYPLTIEVAPLADKKQYNMHTRPDHMWGDYAWQRNAKILPASAQYKGSAYDIFPTPKSVKENAKKRVNVPATVALSVDSQVETALEGATDYIAARLARCGHAVATDAAYAISAKVDEKIHTNAEYYEMEVGQSAISIVGASAVGVLNGLKTLVAVLERNPEAIPSAKIKDWPDLNYRGFMIDLARNFIGYEAQLKLIDRLAAYKVNVLQYHFNDDEGWRLEIPSLPELAQVGGRRGYTLDDSTAGHLIQVYSGTGNAHDTTGSANGYLTADKFVALLKYANARGVRVIPELETPGHARAAIVAMKNRHHRLSQAGNTTEKDYILWDPDDKSVYVSAQGHHDNVLNVAQDDVYRFALVVANDLKKMYEQAGLILTTLHLGGDEVPGHCWELSPMINALKVRENLKTDHDVAAYYMKRVSRDLAAAGLKIAGWQEIATHKTDEYAAEVAPRVDAITVWSTLGRRDTIAYDLANKGYKVVLSNVNNFYMDLVYAAHKNERGLTWGGKCDEFISFNNQPYYNYYSARETWEGDPIDLTKAADGKVPLIKSENIVGVQSQLWSETIRNYSMVEYYIFPKIFGMVERGWNANPEWGGKNTFNEALYDAAITQYNLKIALKELPQLQREGVNFHVAQPGMIVDDGMLKLNAQYPDAVIRYTTDGSEPTIDSPVWTEPVPCGNPALVRAATYYHGHRSHTTEPK